MFPIDINSYDNLEVWIPWLSSDDEHEDDFKDDDFYDDNFDDYEEDFEVDY